MVIRHTIIVLCLLTNLSFGQGGFFFVDSDNDFMTMGPQGFTNTTGWSWAILRERLIDPDPAETYEEILAYNTGWDNNGERLAMRDDDVAYTTFTNILDAVTYTASATAKWTYYLKQTNISSVINGSQFLFMTHDGIRPYMYVDGEIATAEVITGSAAVKAWTITNMTDTTLITFGGQPFASGIARSYNGNIYKIWFFPQAMTQQDCRNFTYSRGAIWPENTNGLGRVAPFGMWDGAEGFASGDAITAGTLIKNKAPYSSIVSADLMVSGTVQVVSSYPSKINQRRR